eukprot:5393985-Pyramimonas_sp.AAC.2
MLVFRTLLGFICAQSLGTTAFGKERMRKSTGSQELGKPLKESAEVGYQERECYSNRHLY